MAAVTIPGGTKLVAIVGETGSGKSALAMELALANGGEIIAADSRTVYKGMDIGTAKPTRADQEKVPHHLLDVVNPDQRFTVQNFQEQAQAAIKDIQNRGRLPFLVGGTGLYVNAVLYDFRFRPAASAQERERLNQLSVTELQQEIAAKGLQLPDNKQNPRHLVRTLEAGGIRSQKQPLPTDTLLLGLRRPQETLKKRLQARTETMVKDGLVQEAQALANEYGWQVEAMQTPAYKAVHEYLLGNIDLEGLKQQFVQSDLQLAKRQRTWFKRNQDIRWI